MMQLFLFLFNESVCVEATYFLCIIILFKMLFSVREIVDFTHLSFNSFSMLKAFLFCCEGDVIATDGY